METSLHRQLKELYCREDSGREVRVGKYRIDAVADGVLVEIQQASLGALRQKIAALLKSHRVLVVKPLALRKTIIKRTALAGAPPAESRRISPKHDTIFHMFDDLVHFVDVFPNRRLTLEVLLTEQEEHRVSKPVRRRRYQKDYRVVDRSLAGVIERRTFRTARDLRALLPPGLEEFFTTEQLAELSGIPRWLAQKMAYCLRMTGGVRVVGKRGRATLYRAPRPRKAA